MLHTEKQRCMSVASHTDRHVHSYSTLSSDNVPKKRRDSPTVHVLPFAPDLKRKCVLIRTIAQAGKQPATRHSKWLASLATAVLAPTQVGMLLALQAFTCRNLQDLRWNTATHRFTRRREPVVRLGARSCKDVLCRNQGVSHIDMSLLPRRSSCKKM